GGRSRVVPQGVHPLPPRARGRARPLPLPGARPRNRPRAAPGAAALHGVGDGPGGRRDPRMSAPTPERTAGTAGHAERRRVRHSRPETEAILDRALAGDRMSGAEARLLFEEGTLTDLALASDAVRRRHHPDPIVT